MSTLGLLGDEITKFEDISALEGNMPILKSSKKRNNKSQGNKKGYYFVLSNYLFLMYYLAKIIKLILFYENYTLKQSIHKTYFGNTLFSEY